VSTAVQQTRAAQAGTALALLATRDELKFLDRAERMALLCSHVAEGVPTDTEVDADGNVVTVVTPAGRAFYLKCLEMLMKASGDYDKREQPNGPEVERRVVHVEFGDLAAAYLAKQSGENK
jgi:hypothetical protein